MGWGDFGMIHVHLYGKLRRFAANPDPTSESAAIVPWEGQCTIADLVGRLGIPLEELGSNLFLNGRYATLESPVADGDRLGLFPDDMQLLYKWYFAPPPAAGPSSGSAAPNLSTDDLAPGSGKSKSGSREPET